MKKDVSYVKSHLAKKGLLWFISKDLYTERKFDYMYVELRDEENSGNDVLFHDDCRKHFALRSSVAEFVWKTRCFFCGNTIDKAG